MKVESGTVVTLEYDITREDGEIVESSDISGRVSFVQGRSGLIPGLDKRLVGMELGQEATFEFPPEEAFGRVEDAPKKTLPKDSFPKEQALDVGSEFEAGLGSGQTIRLRVADVAGDNVVVQMIHPLAGQVIGMSVKVVGVRKATPAELETGKVQTAPPPPPKKG